MMIKALQERSKLGSKQTAGDQSDIVVCCCVAARLYAQTCQTRSMRTGTICIQCSTLPQKVLMLPVVRTLCSTLPYRQDHYSSTMPQPYLPLVHPQRSHPQTTRAQQKSRPLPESATAQRCCDRLSSTTIHPCPPHPQHLHVNGEQYNQIGVNSNSDQDCSYSAWSLTGPSNPNSH